MKIGETIMMRDGNWVASAVVERGRMVWLEQNGKSALLVPDAWLEELKDLRRVACTMETTFREARKIVEGENASEGYLDEPADLTRREALLVLKLVDAIKWAAQASWSTRDFEAAKQLRDRLQREGAVKP